MTTFLRRVFRPGVAILGLLVLGAAVLGLAAYLADQRQAGPGTEADWVAAISTLAAFLAAVVAAAYAKRAVAREEKRDERWLQEQEQAQARVVAAWPGELSYWHDPQDEDTGALGTYGPDRVPVTLVNASPVPVTEVAFKAHASATYCGKSVELAGSAFAPHLPPTDGQVMLAYLTPITPLPDLTETVLSWEIEVSLIFRDSSGRWWLRDANQGLRKLDLAPDQVRGFLEEL